MDDIKIKDKELKSKFRNILNEYSKNVSQDDLDFIKLVILRFKENSSNEYYVVLILIY
jgi:hypothetical protein